MMKLFKHRRCTQQKPVVQPSPSTIPKGKRSGVSKVFKRQIAKIFSANKPVHVVMIHKNKHFIIDEYMSSEDSVSIKSGPNSTEEDVPRLAIIHSVDEAVNDGLAELQDSAAANAAVRPAPSPRSNSSNSTTQLGVRETSSSSDAPLYSCLEYGSESHHDQDSEHDESTRTTTIDRELVDLRIRLDCSENACEQYRIESEGYQKRLQTLSEPGQHNYPAIADLKELLQLKDAIIMNAGETNQQNRAMIAELRDSFQFRNVAILRLEEAIEEKDLVIADLRHANEGSADNEGGQNADDRVAEFIVENHGLRKALAKAHDEWIANMGTIEQLNNCIGDDKLPICYKQRNYDDATAIMSRNLSERLQRKKEELHQLQVESFERHKADQHAYQDLERKMKMVVQMNDILQESANLMMEKNRNHIARVAEDISESQTLSFVKEDFDTLFHHDKAMRAKVLNMGASLTESNAEFRVEYKILYQSLEEAEAKLAECEEVKRNLDGQLFDQGCEIEILEGQRTKAIAQQQNAVRLEHSLKNSIRMLETLGEDDRYHSIISHKNTAIQALRRRIEEQNSEIRRFKETERVREFWAGSDDYYSAKFNMHYETLFDQLQEAYELLDKHNVRPNPTNVTNPALWTAADRTIPVHDDCAFSDYDELEADHERSNSAETDADRKRFENWMGSDWVNPDAPGSDNSHPQHGRDHAETPTGTKVTRQEDILSMERLFASPGNSNRSAELACSPREAVAGAAVVEEEALRADDFNIFARNALIRSPTGFPTLVALRDSTGSSGSESVDSPYTGRHVIAAGRDNAWRVNDDRLAQMAVSPLATVRTPDPAGRATLHRSPLGEMSVNESSRAGRSEHSGSNCTQRIPNSRKVPALSRTRRQLQDYDKVTREMPFIERPASPEKPGLRRIESSKTWSTISASDHEDRDNHSSPSERQGQQHLRQPGASLTAYGGF